VNDDSFPFARQAVCPPCVFTEFATCPRPMKINKLKTKIEAGELMYGEQH
jgi:uncharacterized protein (DUF1684 family)